MKELTAQDPLAAVARKLNRYWQRQVQRRLIASTLGVYADNVANHASDMVVSDAVGGLDADIIIMLVRLWVIAMRA